MKKLKLSRFFTLFVLMISLVLVAVGCSDSKEGESGTDGDKPTSDGDPVTLKVATNNTQTSWYQYSSALAEVLKETTPAINLDVLPIAASMGNIELLEQGEADFGLTQNVVAKWAYDGEIAFEEKHEDLRGLVGGINDYYIGVIARTDFLEKNNIESLADVKEKEIPMKVITNPVGSLAEYGTRLTLEAYDLDYDMIESFGGSIELTSNDVIKSSLQNGQSDLHILVMSKAHPVITEIALSTDITVMELEDEAIEFLSQYGMEDDVFPAGEFKGQDEEVRTAGFVSSYITNADLDEELAYTITKAIHENKERLVQGHSSVNDFDPDKAANEELLLVPLHPGAERYYEEIGLLK